jgi:hypothetical protein
MVVTMMHRGCHFYPFLPPLVPFLAPLAAALGGAAWLATGGRFRVAQNESRPNCFFTRGMLGGDIYQLLSGAKLIPSKLMDQGTTCRIGPER